MIHTRLYFMFTHCPDLISIVCWAIDQALLDVVLHKIWLIFYE